MNLDSSVTIPATVVSRMTGDELVLLDLAGGEYFGLDAIGACVWQLLEEGKTLREVAAMMLEQYEVDEFQLQEDISVLVVELIAKKLLECR